MEESSLFETLFSNPFVRGLLLGLLACVVLWVRSFLKTRELNANMKKLREHLHTKLEIDSEDNERRKRDLDQVRQERDNLRNMVQVLNQKPGRQEMRQYHIYQKAIDIMFEKAPGFAPAWQITLKEAEEEMKNAERGIIPFFKRMKPSSSFGGTHNDEARKKALQLQDHSNH